MRAVPMLVAPGRGLDLRPAGRLPLVASVRARVRKQVKHGAEKERVAVGGTSKMLMLAPRADLVGLGVGLLQEMREVDVQLPSGRAVRGTKNIQVADIMKMVGVRGAHKSP